MKILIRVNIFADLIYDFMTLRPQNNPHLENLTETFLYHKPILILKCDENKAISPSSSASLPPPDVQPPSSAVHIQPISMRFFCVEGFPHLLFVIFESVFFYIHPLYTPPSPPPKESFRRSAVSPLQIHDRQFVSWPLSLVVFEFPLLPISV